VYEVSAGVRSTRSEDGAILLDLTRGQVLRLNSTGSLVFEYLRQGQTEAQIVDRLNRDFPVSERILRSDVREFIQALAQKKLICSKGTGIFR